MQHCGVLFAGAECARKAGFSGNRKLPRQ